MFTCSKVINAFKRGPTRFGKALNFYFLKLSSQNMRGFNSSTILSPSFHGLHKERLAQWPDFLRPQKRTKNSGGVLPEKLGGVCSTPSFLKPLSYFRPKSVIFPVLFQTWSKIWYPISGLKPWSSARDRSAWQAVTVMSKMTVKNIWEESSSTSDPMVGRELPSTLLANMMMILGSASTGCEQKKLQGSSLFPITGQTWRALRWF